MLISREYRCTEVLQLKLQVIIPEVHELILVIHRYYDLISPHLNALVRILFILFQLYFQNILLFRFAMITVHL